MNKKFSTLMTASFLMVGALFSNANAQAVAIDGTAVIPATSKADYFAAGKTFKAYISTGAADQLLDTVWVRKDKNNAASDYKVTLAKAAATKANATMFTVSFTSVNGKLQLSLKAGEDNVIFKNDGAFLGTVGEPNGEYIDGDITNSVGIFDLDGTTLTAYDPSDAAKGLQMGLTGFTDKNIAFSTLAFSTGATAQSLFFYLPNNAPVADINNKLGTGKGFSLKFPETTPAIANNPFANRVIQAVSYSGNTYLKTSGAVADLNSVTPKEFAAAEFIALDTIPLTTDNSSDFNGKKGAGYQFKIVKGSEMLVVKADGSLGVQDTRKRNLDNAQFTISNNANNPDSLIIELAAPKFGFDTKKAVKDHVTVSAYQTSGSAADDKVRVSIINFAGQNYVTTYNGGTTFNVAPTRWSNIKFGSSNIVARKDMMGIVNIVNMNTIGNVDKKDNVGKVYGPNGWMLPSMVQLNKPEGQFRIIATADGEFQFYNRESGADPNYSNPLYFQPNLYKVSGLRKTEVANVYTQNNGDTIKITPVTVEDKYVGYKNYSKHLELENTSYTIAVYSAVTENVYLTEKHSSDHLIGLTTTAEDATHWRLVKFEDAKTDALTASDTLKLTGNMTYKDGNDFKTKDDSVVVFTYALYNEAVGEYMMFDMEKKAFYCSYGTSKVTNPREAAKFVVKEKGDGMYNLVYVIPQEKVDGVYEASSFYPSYNYNGYKLYGAFSENKVSVKYAYEYTDNDLFVIKAVEAPKYRTVTPLDTVKVYRENNDKEFLFEQNGFLGVKNIAQFGEIKPAMFVDTAFVKNSINKPQYMLAMNPKIGSESCNDPSHVKHDSIIGRYLVNLVDSAKLYENIHNNKYKWDGMSKLGFVNACHKNNKLYILRANGIAQKGDTLNVGEDNKNSVAKFAFRFVDKNQSAFKIETSLDGSKDNVGYVKYHNGVPVVTNRINDAEVFNIAETSDLPTNNEGIDATEVSVVAGAGSVTINNAAGKAVVISNILGQTIANTTITSDNETITVPAGIVVVSVDGEAVKAIVK